MVPESKKILNNLKVRITPVFSFQRITVFMAQMFNKQQIQRNKNPKKPPSFKNTGGKPRIPAPTVT